MVVQISAFEVKKRHPHEESFGAKAASYTDPYHTVMTDMEVLWNSLGWR
jgi:hypothetical protein